MQVDIISAQHNLIEYIARQLAANGADYTSNLVIFPGKRPAHFLRKYLAKQGTTNILPPRIVSIDEFIDLVYTDKLGYHTRLLDTIDAIALLFKIHTHPDKAYRHLGRKHFLTPDRFFPLGLKLYTDLEELYIEQVAIEQVHEIDTLISIPQPTFDRLQSLSYFYTKFYHQLKTKHYSTRASRYRKVADAICIDHLAEFNRIIFAGFFAFTAAEKQIFHKLKDSDKVSYIFQSGKGLDRKLTELGVKDSELQLNSQPQNLLGTLNGKSKNNSEIRNPQSTIYFYKTPDTHGQALELQTILDNIKTKPDAKLDEKTAVILPASETLFPIIHHTLSSFEESEYNIALGYPISRTPLFGFFNNLMEVVNSMDADGRVYIPRYLEFMLHPYTKNIYYRGSAQSTRILMHTIEETLLTKRNRTFWKLEEIERYPELRKALQQKLQLEPESDQSIDDLIEYLSTLHQQTILKFSRFNTFREFVQNAIEILNYIYEQSTARRHQLFYPYSESFLAALDTLSHSLLSDISFQEQSSYFILFRKYIETCSVPFTGTPVRGLQVLGLLETRNIQFDTVYLLDFNEGIVPATKREDTLLPVKIRQALQLPTYLDREQLIGYYLDILFTGAQEVHLFYIENDEKEKSRFAELLLWQLQKTEGSENKSIKTKDSVPKTGFIKTIQYNVGLHTTPPQPISKTPAMLDFLKRYEYNATAVNTYFTCPLQFYYGTVLGLEEKEEFSDRTEKREIGTLVHQILSDFFKPYLNQPLAIKSSSIQELEKLITHRMQAEYGPALSGASYLIHRQIMLHLKEFFEQYQIPLLKQEKVSVLAVEQKLAIQNNGYYLKGFLDRIDLRNGTPVIIDYKTSASDGFYTIHFNQLDFTDPKSWRDAIPTLQLPFYQLLYAESNQIPITSTRSMFLLLGKKGLGANIECPLFKTDEPDLENKLKGLVDIIFTILNEINSLEIYFKPTDTPKNTCSDCQFRNICY